MFCRNDEKGSDVDVAIKGTSVGAALLSGSGIWFDKPFWEKMNPSIQSTSLPTMQLRK